MPACQLIGLKSYFFVYCYSKFQQGGAGGEGERKRISFVNSREYKSRKCYLNIIFQNERKMKSNTKLKKIKRQYEKFLKSTQFFNIPQESVVLVRRHEDSENKNLLPVSLS